MKNAFTADLVTAVEMADAIFIDDEEVRDVHIVVNDTYFFIKRDFVKAANQPLDFEQGEAVFTSYDHCDRFIRLHRNGQPITLSDIKGITA